LTKEGDGSKSSYIAHIGGFFTFVALAGLSLIGWGLNHHCWSKKSCCFKEYHNPLNIRVFWWMSFMGLCGVFACCISGFVTSHYFSNKVQTTKCVYERVYYDSKYGEIKKNITKWEGLEEINRQAIIKKFEEFLYINKTDNYVLPFDFDKNEWNEGDKKLLLDPKVYYKKSFQDQLKNDIIKKCIQYPGSIRDLKGELICDSNLTDHNSFIYEYINEVTRITKYFSDEVNQIKDFINPDKRKQREKSYGNEVNVVNNTLKNISDDLNNYKTVFLDKADYYIEVSKICGYILVTIYYSILLAIVVCSCFLLWAYSYFKEQRLIYTFMHVAWNILKFFSFSFFMFGAAFGALYLVSRDLIGYNQFLFNDNLASNATTYLLPNGASKEFLRYCINEEDSNYINNFELPTILLLKDLYNNMNKGKNINEKNYNFTKLSEKITCYYVFSEDLRNIQEITDTEQIIDTFELDFSEVGNKVKEMINQIHNELYHDSNLRILQKTESNIINEIGELGKTIDKLNCGFLKTEIQILYDSLYGLSIESRISCALCCCIGFFLEFSIAFYLLVLYHYNNNEFKDDNDTQKSFPKNRNRKFDLDSQNEFMDKSRPPNMKKNNRKLDLEFNFN
jgi:hypothetical protein